ncbi:protein of unknown function (DUF748) [Fodinibius salinus]|uniref:DUF748 domain-containing protein n=2 Tax=Fodinibius salinus TaxID=860790 RepID=A0A5D3YN18_9BACT|nr:protein of unknown function (DUF748) [Fodinibius salinus]
MVGGIQIYFSFFLDSQIKQTLTNRVQQSINHSFSLTINDLDLHLLGRRITISGATLSSKKQDKKNNLYATIEDIHIRGISFWQLLIYQKLNLKKVQIINPHISLTKAPSSNSSITPRDIRKKLSSNDVLKQQSIPKFSVTGLSLNYTTKNKQNGSSLSFRDSDIHLYEISLDSAALTSNKIITAKNIITDFRDLQYRTANGVYKLSTNQIVFSSFDSSMNIRSLQLKPQFDKASFPKQFKYETNRISLNIPTVEIQNLDPLQLNKANGITAQKVQINKPNLDIFKDKHAPFPPNRQPPLPQQMLKNIPFTLDIDSLSIENGNIKYSQLNPRADTTGYILFADLNADFTNLSNLQNRTKKTNPPTLSVRTNVMDSARLQVQFTFPTSTLKQHISGHLDSMDMRAFNSALEPMAFVRVDKGQILDMNFDMVLDKQEATGKVAFRYKDLKISLLDKESKKEDFGKKMKSLLANTIKIKSKNRAEDLRIGKVNFKRIERKAVFNYWWKSLLSGLKPSIGL